MEDLNRLQEMVLLAVWKLKDNAYSVTIRKLLSEITGRVFPYGTLYGTLDALSRRGYVIRKTGDPTPRRGGRSKNFYHITAADWIAALKAALELNKAVWDRQTELALNRT